MWFSNSFWGYFETWQTHVESIVKAHIQLIKDGLKMETQLQFLTSYKFEPISNFTRNHKNEQNILLD